MQRYTFQENPTIFGKILRGEIPCNKIYEDEKVLAFHDINPKAPTHVLIIPKNHVEGIQDAEQGDEEMLGYLLVVSNKIAKQLGVHTQGFRLITNAGSGAGQEVPHLHVHLLAGSPRLPGF